MAQERAVVAGRESSARDVSAWLLSNVNRGGAIQEYEERGGARGRIGRVPQKGSCGYLQGLRVSGRYMCE